MTRYKRAVGLGVVTIGSGGSASSFQFDPTTGLSNDPNLAYDLQGLTPTQLQTALTNPSGVTSDLLSLLHESLTGTGAGTLPCGDPNGPDPNCNGGLPVSTAVPTWAWVAGIAAIALLVFRK